MISVSGVCPAGKASHLDNITQMYQVVGVREWFGALVIVRLARHLDGSSLCFDDVEDQIRT